MRAQSTLINRRTLLARAAALASVGALARIANANAEDGAVATPAATPVPISPELFTAFGVRATTAEGWPIDVILATPDFLRLAGREADIQELQAATALVVCAARTHGGALTGDDAGFRVTIRIDAAEPVSPTEKRLMRDENGVREDAFIFRDIPPAVTAENHLLEVLLPGSDPAQPLSVPFITPLVLPGPAGTPEPGSTATDGSESDVDWMETALPSEEIEVC